MTTRSLPPATARVADGPSPVGAARDAKRPMPRILLLTPSAPWPPDNGTRQRTNLLYRGLARCGVVDCAVVSPGPVPLDAPTREVLRERFGLVDALQGRPIGDQPPWSLIRTLAGQRAANMAAHALVGWHADFSADPQARRWLGQRTGGRAYDLIVSRYLWPAAHVGVGAGERLVIDIDDFESQRLASQLAVADWPETKRRWWRRRVRQVRRFELRYLRLAKHAFVAKPQDAQGIIGTPTSVLPNVPFFEGESVPPPLPPARDSQTILFIGTLEFGPNVRAMQRLIDCSWPQIKAACPNAVLRIAGGGLPEATRAAWASVPGVEPIGYVSDVSSAYRDAAFSIVPIWEGAGTKIKLAESLLWGRTAVCARHSLSGYEQHLSHGEHLWVADDDAQVAAGCVALLRDAARREAWADAGRAVVLDHYTPQSFYEKVVAVVEALRGASRDR